MPKGIYKRTKEHRENISKALKGRRILPKNYKHTKEIRRKISIGLKEHFKISSPHMGFKGKHHSEEVKKKISKSMREYFRLKGTSKC